MEEWIGPLISGIVVLILVFVWWTVPPQVRSSKTNWTIPIVFLMYVTVAAASVFFGFLLVWVT